MDRRETGQRERERERDTRDYRNETRESDNRDSRDMRNYRDNERTDNRKNRSRSPTSSRTKSPSRWDDPIKQFSEKHKPERPPKHRPPPNRFNIPPGRQWDGVDRSNGFEVAYFKKLAQQERKKDLDYKYTVADM